MSKGNIKHGAAKQGAHTPAYRVWCDMRKRCTRPYAARYPRYGGRGITVCERWQSFENFLADMGERPNGMSLDRIDNDGNYEPGNCRWATAKEQARGCRRFIEYAGLRLSLEEWSTRLGITRSALWVRLKGWPLDRALTQENMR